jgi:hypothetical protein
MGGWVIFFVGGVIGFCLGVLCFILIISIGDPELCLKQIDIKEH